MRCRRWNNGPTASPRYSTISAAAKRCSSQSPARSRPRHCSPRHIRPAPQRSSCSRASRIPLQRRPTGRRARNSAPPLSPCGAPASTSTWSIQTCRGTKRSGLRGLECERLWRRAHGPLCSCGRLWAMWTCGRFCRQSACLRSSSITSTTRSSSPQGVGTWPRTFPARNTSSSLDATCTTSSNRGETRFKRSQSSSPAIRLTSPTTGYSRPCSSPTSSTRRDGPLRSVTVTGTHYSMRTTPWSACNSIASGAVK